MGKSKTDTRSGYGRLMMLKGLTAGWLDGQGEAICEAAFRTACRALRLAPDLGRVGGIFPTLSGGIQVETDEFEVIALPGGALRLTDERSEDGRGRDYPAPGDDRDMRAFLDDLAPMLERLDTPGEAPEKSERFAELRGGGVQGAEIAFTPGRVLFDFEEPLLMLADAGGREAILMRVPEDEAGADYMLAVPAANVLADLHADRICLRQACLHEATELFLANVGEDGNIARRLTGPVHEYLLPADGVFASEVFAPEEASHAAP